MTHVAFPGDGDVAGVRSDELRVAGPGSVVGVGGGGDGDELFCSVFAFLWRLGSVVDGELCSARQVFLRLFVGCRLDGNWWWRARWRGGLRCRRQIVKILAAWRLEGGSGWLDVVLALAV